MNNEPDSDRDRDAEYAVYIDAAGNLAVIHDDDLVALLGAAAVSAVTRRAACVEPGPDGKNWTIDTSPLTGVNQIAASFPRRDLALAAEVIWLEKYLEGGESECRLEMPALPE